MTTKKKTTQASILSSVRKSLAHTELDWTPDVHLDTGIADLNEVLGNRKLGIPYGRPIEIAGEESNGKTALAITLAGIAQQGGAFVVWVDFENSYDERWAIQRGLDPSKNFLLLQTYIGTFEKEKTERLIFGNELCSEMEATLPLIYQKHKRIFLVLDSIAAILLPENADDEITGFKANMALATFLSKRFPRWTPMFRNYCVLPIFINQLRQNPMAMFKDPWYSVGGNAQKFYYHVRTRVARAKGGKLMHMGKQIGIQGVMRNIKNKSGGVENSRIAYKIFFDGPTEFLDADTLTRAPK